MKTGVLRNEDQKSAVRSLREYLDTVKQKRLPKDSTSTSEAATGKEKDASSRTNVTPIPVTGSSQAPNLSTITEASQGDEDSQGLPAPKLQRLASEENQSASSVVPGISTPTSTGTASSTASTNEVGGDVGGAEEMGAVTTAKGQEAVGGTLPSSTGVLPSTPHSATLTNQFEPSNLLIAKRSDTTPALTTVAQANRAPSSEPVPSSAQNALGATSQSNIYATPDHQNTALPEEERKTTSRTNSNESEKGSQNQATSGSSPDKKHSIGSEGLPQVQKEATSVQPLSSSTAQTSSSRSFIIPVGPAESSGGGGGGGMSRASSEESATATATPTNPPAVVSVLLPHELVVIQSEHSAESTPTHMSQGSLESTSTSTISSQEQLSSQEVKGDKEKLSTDKLAATGEKGTNGTLKKKGQRGKSKQIKLNLVEMTDEKVAKCALVTGAGQMVNFQFSVKYDKPPAIFQKLVSLSIFRTNACLLLSGISP